ncbi:MAG: hypothetical protein FWF54_07095 [Candidatus Azobacteroides sp.]|nr:hypothetical protein [Candidatus Azobacteroides sp.]
MKTVFITRAALVGILMVILSFSFLGEKMAVNEGAGWDGDFYREFARSFDTQIKEGGYSIYTIQRIAPFALINVVYNSFGISKDNASLMVGVCILNIISIIISVCYFFKISTWFRFSSTIEMIGFASLFFTFPVLKNSGYNPFYTDIFALTAMLAAYYFFLKKRMIKLLLIGILSAFIWQTSWVIILFLLFFPNQKFNLVDKSVKQTKGVSASGIVCKIIVLLYALAALFFMVYFLYIKQRDLLPVFFAFNNEKKPLLLLGFSLLLFLIFMYRTMKDVRFDLFVWLKAFFKSVKPLNILLFLSAYLLMFAFQYKLSNPEIHSPYTIYSTIYRLIGEPLLMPLRFLEAHFVYYGLLPVLVVLCWKRILPLLGNYGTGYFFAMVYFLIFATQSESRFSINMLPFIVFPLLVVFSELQFKKWVPVAYIIIQIILSKCWLRINVDGIVEGFAKFDYLNFPSQRFFMEYGNFQNNEMYGIFFALMIIFTGIVYVCHKKRYLYVKQ